MLHWTPFFYIKVHPPFSNFKKNHLFVKRSRHERHKKLFVKIKPEKLGSHYQKLIAILSYLTHFYFFKKVSVRKFTTKFIDLEARDWSFTIHSIKVPPISSKKEGLPLKYELGTVLTKKIKSNFHLNVFRKWRVTSFKVQVIWLLSYWFKVSFEI